MIWLSLLALSIAAAAVMAPPLYARVEAALAPSAAAAPKRKHKAKPHAKHGAPPAHGPAETPPAVHARELEQDGRVAALKAELEELERDVAAGVITAAAAETARLEAQRRLLAAAQQLDAPYVYDATAQKRALKLMPAVALILPALTGILYLGVGSPGLGDFPMRTRPDMASIRGEKLVLGNNGQVSPDATAEFRAALAFDPTEPRARYFLALGKSQSGDVAGALSDWVLLLKSAPKDAPWRGLVRTRIEEAARTLNRDLATLGLPDDKPGGNEQAESEMIRSMVARLEARLTQNPEDVEGWVRLGRSWLVLAEPDKARSAFERALTQAPKHVEALLGRARALAPAQENAPPSETFLDALRAVLAVDPNQPEALWTLGAAAEDAGRGDEALGYYRRLLPLIPADAPVKKIVEERVKKLGG